MCLDDNGWTTETFIEPSSDTLKARELETHILRESSDGVDGCLRAQIGGAPIPVGGVVRVRLLGALALLDQNETDWKLVVLSTRDPRVSEWRDVSDVPPDTRRQLYEFFRTYKVAEGKQINHFFVAADQAPTSRPEDWDKAFFGRDVATAVVQAKHNDWRRLLGLNPGGSCTTPLCVPLLTAAREDGSVVAVSGKASGDAAGDSGSMRSVKNGGKGTTRNGHRGGGIDAHNGGNTTGNAA